MPLADRIKGFFRKKRPVRQYLALFSMMLILAFVLFFSFYPRSHSPSPSANSHVGSLRIIPYFMFQHGIYHDTGAVPSAGLGKKLGTAAYLSNGSIIYAIKGTDPSKSVAVVNDKITRCDLVVNDTFEWNGSRYRINDPFTASGQNSDRIGKIGECDLFAIANVQTSQKIQVEIGPDLFVDAARIED